MIKLDGVKKSFGKKTVLKGIDGELGEGVYGLLGPNGAGKTTLMYGGPLPFAGRSHCL